MRNTVLTLIATTATIFTIGSATASPAAEARQYTATYHSDRNVYCIRFYADSYSSPIPNNPAPTCMSRERWEKQSVFIEHRGRDGSAAGQAITD